MRLEHVFSATIVVLLAIDVVLMYKMVYGNYPWEGAAQ